MTKKILFILCVVTLFARIASAMGVPCDKPAIFMPMAAAAAGGRPELMAMAREILINCTAETRTEKIHYGAAYTAETGASGRGICNAKYSDLVGDDFGQLVNVACRSNIELIYAKYFSLWTMGSVSYPVTLDAAADGTCEDWSRCLEYVFWEFDPYPISEPALTDGLWEKSGYSYYHTLTGVTCTYDSTVGYLDCGL